LHVGKSGESWLLDANSNLEYECCLVKGRSKHVEIYLDVGPSKTKTLLARVDIGQLGMSEWFQRYMGNTQHIWVKGRVPSAHKTTSWPLMGQSEWGLEKSVFEDS
jgi:hypothetical protein